MFFIVCHLVRGAARAMSLIGFGHGGEVVGMGQSLMYDGTFRGAPLKLGLSHTTRAEGLRDGR